MNVAWEGYSRGRRRLLRKRRRRLAAIAVVAALGLLFGLQRCLPQGVFGGRSFAFAGARAVDDNPASAALVIYNANDPLSRDLAEFYAQKREIPAERVVALACPTEEEITREQYDDSMAGPLRALFDARGWWTRSPDRPGSEPSSIVSRNAIRFLVLMRGIPLRIRQTDHYPGDFCHEPAPLSGSNQASVDSELTVLGMFTRGISGFVPNPYFRAFRRIGEMDLPALMLAGRLDAPTGTTVRQMIIDSLAAEKNGLWGRCYLDGRGMAPGSAPLAEGDKWISSIATDRAPYFLPTIFDHREEMFPVAYPMNDAAMYFGWYNQDVAGPFTRESFRFAPGAVACHIHSFSATSVRDPLHWWVGPLLNKGAAAVLGNVYEPYLLLTTHLDVFADRLFDGSTLAESAWAATPGLSWMNIVAGDPLYRPGLYWKNQEFNLSDGAGAEGSDSTLAVAGRAYWQGAQLWRAKGEDAGGAMLENSARRLHSGFVFEGLGLLEATAGNLARARRAFDQATAAYTDPGDTVRVLLEEASCLARNGQRTEGAELLAAGRRKFAGLPVAAALDDSFAGIPLPAVPHKP